MKNNEVPKINSSFTNISGVHFNNVREIAFKKNELIGNLGTFVNETKHEENNIFFQDDFNYDGVYIYQDFNDKYKAYRIYKCFADYGFNGYFDDLLIQKLVEKQSLINLTKFPTGVVTLEGRIIGQEIPFYPKGITLCEYFYNNTVSNPLTIYKNILLILQELYNNKIVYTDIHPKNFILSEDLKLNLIDFDYSYIKFDEDIKYFENTMFNNLNNMLNNLSKIQNFNFYITENASFDETIDKINKLVKTY